MCRNVYVYTQGGEPKNALPDAAMKARRHPDLKSLAPCERRSEQDYRCHIKAHNHSKNELTKSALLPQKQQEHKKQQQHKNTRGDEFACGGDEFASRVNARSRQKTDSRSLENTKKQHKQMTNRRLHRNGTIFTFLEDRLATVQGCRLHILLKGFHCNLDTCKKGLQMS